MAIQVKIRRQLTPGSVTTQDYTDSGLTETVKALFNVFNKSVTGTGGSETFWGLGCGMATGTGVGVGDQFTQMSSIRPLNNHRNNTCDEAVVFYATTGTGGEARNQVATLDSFITNGARLNFTTSSNQITNAAVLFGGSSLSVASDAIPDIGVGRTAVVDTGLSNVDLVLVMGGTRFAGGFANACAVATQAGSGFAWGAAAKRPNGTIQQACCHKTSASSMRVATDRIWEFVAYTSPGAPTLASRITDITGGRITFDADGLGSDPEDFAWMAFDFGGAAQASVRTFTSNRSSSTVDVDVEMVPMFAMLTGTYITAFDTTDTSTAASPFSIGMIDTDEQNVSSVVNNDGSDLTTPATYTRSGECLVTMAEGGGSLTQVASGSFSGTNVRLSYSTNDATADRVGFLVAIGTPGDIAVDEAVSVLDDSHAQITNLLSPDTDAVLVLDDVQAVLSAAPVEPQRGQRPKTTARAGVQAADTARPGADALGTASS